MVLDFDDCAVDNDNERHESEHRQCHAKSEPIPCAAKRVLDLTNANEGKIFLIEAAGLIEPYAALSHCWIRR